MALTDLGIRRLKAPKPGKRREKYDGEIRGFGIRITDRGIRSYILLYSHFGRRRRYTIGRVGELSIDEAREEARRLRGLIRQGRDPAAEEKAARAVAKVAASPKTFFEIVDLYEKRVLASKRRGRQARMTIDLHLMPYWKDMPLTSITRPHVLERVEMLVDAGKSEMARGVFQICRRLFNWAITRGTFGLEHSPCEKLRPADLIGERRVRERILTDREWRALLRASTALGFPYQQIVELLSLTGLRRNEVVEARWSEFDFDQARWTIPSSRMKGARVHVVPLTPRMIEILNSLPRKGEFLFPNDRGNRPFTSFGRLKEKIDARMAEELRHEEAEAKLESWTFHDIRRSMRTKLSELPIPGGDLVRELLLAHAKPGLHKVYDQFAYTDERLQAYKFWQEKLAAILEKRSASVIDLARRAGER
jgi:integrase